MQRGAPERWPGAERLRAMACLMAGITLVFLASCTPPEQNRRVVLATVNGQKITFGDLLSELRARRGPGVLVEIVDTHLILAAAEKAGLTVSDEEMQLRMERAVSEVGSEADFEARLQAMRTTRDRFAERLRVDLLLDKLARADMHISEQEVKDFYRDHQEEFRLGARVRARMILVSSQADADTVYEALQQPDSDFAGLAKALSIDPATRDQGGDMGYFEREDYAKEIADVAFSLEVGQLSKVFKAPDGYCMLKVEGRKPPGVMPLAEVAKQIRARIAIAKQPSARHTWIAKAREGAAIAIEDDELREATIELLKRAPTPQPVSLMPALMPYSG